MSQVQVYVYDTRDDVKLKLRELRVAYDSLLVRYRWNITTFKYTYRRCDRLVAREIHEIHVRLATAARIRQLASVSLSNDYNALWSYRTYKLARSTMTRTIPGVHTISLRYLHFAMLIENSMRFASLPVFFFFRPFYFATTWLPRPTGRDFNAYNDTWNKTR